MADADKSNTSGIIELSIRGEWRGVCDNDWNDVDAKVACRELGLPFASKFCLLIVLM